VRKIETACHTAYYCPVTGQGRLVLPAPLDGPGAWESLYASDGVHMLRRLALWGVVPAEDDETCDPWSTVGHRADGREVVALYVLDPIITKPTEGELAEADRELDALAGVVRLPAQRQGSTLDLLDVEDSAAS
jgi:hypothetical protein